MTVPPEARVSSGHPATVDDGPVDVHQAGRQVPCGQPVRGALAEDQRRRGRGVGVDARAGGDGHGAPARGGRAGRCGGRPRGGPGVPPSDQWRLPIPEVARPPEDTATAVGASGSPQTSATPITNPPAGCGRTATSPPRETSVPQPRRSEMVAAARSAAHALAVAPRSRTVPGGTVRITEVGVEDDRSPAGNGSRGGQVSGHPGRHLGEVAVVAEALEGATHGRVDEAVGQLGGAEGRGQEVAQHMRHGHGAAARTVDPAELRIGSEAAGRRPPPGRARSSRRRAAATTTAGSVTSTSMRVDQRVVRWTARRVRSSSPSRRAQLEPLVTGAWR